MDGEQEPREVTVILIPEAHDAAERTMARRSLSRTDVINRAVQAYDFLDAEMDAGAEVRVHRKDGTVHEVMFL